MARVRVNIPDAAVQRLVLPGGVVNRGAWRVGTAVQSTAAGLAAVDTGRLRQSGDTSVRSGPGTATARVGFYARHAWWVHEGTGIYGPRGAPIRPRRARVLAWRGRAGRWRFARQVRGMRGRPFLARATQLVTGKSPRRR